MIIEIVDAKEIVIGNAFDLLKEKAEASVLDYNNHILKLFIIVFAIFVSLLTVFMAVCSFYGFKRLRRSMWNSNIILKIIPEKIFKKKDQDRLKEFFMS